MANVSAADVKKLRDATGAGMMDAKKALEEADGNFDRAGEILRVKGAAKNTPGPIGDPVTVGGATIRNGDILVLDADGVAVVEQERISDVLDASRERLERERVKREKLQGGELSYDLDGLREKVEA